MTPVEAAIPHEHKSHPAAPNHWNRGSDLQYTQRMLYHAPPVSSVPAGWPRPPTSFINDFMSIGSHQLPALPPHWHQDPAAIAWMASRHMMLPLTLATAAQHPHNYSSGSIPSGLVHPHNGTLPPPPPSRRYSPTLSTPGGSPDKLFFPCEICGKSFTAKDTLRQVCTSTSISKFNGIIQTDSTANLSFLFNSTCWLTHSLGPLSASSVTPDSPRSSIWTRTLSSINHEHLNTDQMFRVKLNQSSPVCSDDDDDEKRNLSVICFTQAR